MPSAADIIAQRLFNAGCRQAFGIPGGEVLELIDGFKRAGIDFVLVKHENSGGFMAEGTYHFTESPCILLATVGPGVANAVNAVVNAYQDQVPLIYITGCVDADVAQTYTHQVFDHCELLKSVTKASFTLIEGVFDIIIDKAVFIAMDGKPGPVHLDVPISLAVKNQNITLPVRRVTPAISGPVESPELSTAQSVLREAERPLMIAGVEVLHHKASQDVINFCHKFQMPLLTTYKAKGVLPEDNVFAIGAIGLSPKADKIILPIVYESDLILLVGYDPIEMRSSWINVWGSNKSVIEFSDRPNTHYVHQASMNFVGHVGAGLNALSHGVAAKEIWPDNRPSEVRVAHKKAFAGDGSWGPHTIVSTARLAMPRNTIASVDTGAHRILLSQAWECYEPRGLIQSSALCTMGVALPLALGRKLAEPDRPVIVFCGDAGMEMVLGELATARDQKLAIPIIVFVDGSLALIELKQRVSGYDNLGVDFGRTDFAAVGYAMGGVGITITDKIALKDELLKAQSRNTFTLIACPIERNAYDGNI